MAMSNKTKGTLAGAGTGAATGAAVGTVLAPGIGTALGAGIGGIAGGIGGYMSEPDDPAKVAAFKAPDLTYGQKFQQGYDPTGGAQSTIAQEKALGIQAFDPNSYQAKLAGGLRASVDEGVTKERAARGNRAANSGFLNSAAAQNLDERAIGEGERTYAMGLSDIAEDSAGKQLEENRARMGFANTNAENSYSSALKNAEFNENQRQADNAMNYGKALDSYELNVLNPAERADAMNAARTNSRTALYGSILGTGGQIAGAGIAANATKKAAGA